MDTSQLVQSVCRLASDFRLRDDTSMAQLLERSGYLENHALVTEDSLAAYLRAHPELIESWALLSVDQRSSETWYLNAPHPAAPDTAWAVGFYPGPVPVTYSDGPSACAAFIIRYVEQSRSGRLRANNRFERSREG